MAPDPRIGANMVIKMTVDFETKIATRKFVRRGGDFGKPAHQLSALVTVDSKVPHLAT